MNQKQYDELISGWSDSVQWDVDMAAYSTLRAGGRADALIDVQDLDELRNLLCRLEELQVSCRVIGRGSNVLVSEQGYSGVIIRLQGELNSVTRLDEESRSGNPVVIKAGAGCSMSRLVSWCTRHDLTGLEFMVGIPGSVGGAVWMNAGAWRHEIGERLKAIELVDYSGHLMVVPVSELKLSYRNVDLKEGDLENRIISSATFVLKPGREEQIRVRCEQYLGRRRGKQPTGVASAGSFFKNPPGDSAGRLIEAAGLKGASCGQAMVSKVHANFIVNTGRATAADIVTLMQQVQDVVFQQFGIRLEPEVQIL
jgi:UDP-N-acetylmuramate dehydrogenase